MFEKLKELKNKYDHIENKAADPKIIKNREEYKQTLKELKEMTPFEQLFQRYQKALLSISENEDLLEEDPELKNLAEEEIKKNKTEIEKINREVKKLLLPKDPDLHRNVIVEIRAGTGGDEAAIFAGDLFRMYDYYAQKKNLKTEVIEFTGAPHSGFKEIIFSVTGKDAYRFFKYETGTHRVQRIPETESGGRIHTSAATVAVLPEADETEIEIHDQDIKIDTYRASGAGGQHVNKTDSAVRITHIPTGTVVACQDETSQHKNKERAFKILRARIYETEKKAKAEARAKERKEQVGSGDRSERIRTYNFPQNRVTDHRIHKTIHSLNLFITGEMNEIFENLEIEENNKKLSAIEA